MAYPKWTQLSTPSGATAVDAMSTAGDLWKQSMQTIQGGLTAYDKGVETRLQEDSDVNTAALRRRLEGAGTLSELNAMQGDISATGLQGYGKRIDADALSQSFNKERGVMRGEFQDQFNEQISTGYANATTVDEVKAINNQVAAANEKDSWLDVSSQITQGSAGLKTALDKEAQTATDAQVQQQAGMNVAGLEAALDALVPGSLNFTENQTRITNQIAATKDKDQKLFDQGAVSSMRVASGNGLKALEAERDKLLKAAENNPNISEASVLSTFDERRPFALQKVLDNVADSTRNLNSVRLSTNLNAMNEAKSRIPEEFRNMITIDEIGNLSFAPELDEASKQQFAKIATGFGFEAEEGFATRNENFLNESTSLLGGEFGSLTNTEKVFANKLRRDTRQEGLELSTDATTALTKGTTAAKENYTEAVARIDSDYTIERSVAGVDATSLLEINAKGDVYEYVKKLTLMDNQENASSWFGDQKLTKGKLTTFLNDQLSAGYSHNQIIAGIDASLDPKNTWGDANVNTDTFTAFMKEMFIDTETGNIVDKRKMAAKVKLLNSRDSRDAEVAELKLLRDVQIAQFTAEAMKASKVRNTKSNADIITKLLNKNN